MPVAPNEDELRRTVVTLEVSWDPAEHDHPLGWDWETLLECEVNLIDAVDNK